MRAETGRSSNTHPPNFYPTPAFFLSNVRGRYTKGICSQSKSGLAEYRNRTHPKRGLAMLTKNLVSGGQWHTQGFCKYLFQGLHFLATRTRTHARGFLQLAQKKGERGGHPIRFPFRFFHSPPPLGRHTPSRRKNRPCSTIDTLPAPIHTSGNHAPKRRNRAKEKGRLKLKQPSLDDFIRQLGKPSKP